MISVLPLENNTEDDSSWFYDYSVPQRYLYGAVSKSKLLRQWSCPDSSYEWSHRCPCSITTSEVLQCIICKVCALNQQEIWWGGFDSLHCSVSLTMVYIHIHEYHRVANDIVINWVAHTLKNAAKGRPIIPLSDVVSGEASLILSHLAV